MVLFQAVAVLQEHTQEAALMLVVLVLERREPHPLKNRREIRKDHLAKAVWRRG